MSDTINRRGALSRLAGVGAGIILATALPSILEAAPVDPVAAAYAELVEASRAIDRARGGDGFGDSLLAWVRVCVRLHDRLRDEHGAEAGGAIWTAAMERHYDWYCDLHGLDRTQYA